MILWIFSLITLAAVLVTAFAVDIRRATLALWVAGLGVGCIYLTLGAEVLAIIQCIVSTLLAISFSFFGVMFGEYGPGSKQSLKGGGRSLAWVSFSIILGVAFAVLVWFAGGPAPSDLHSIPSNGNDLAAMGRSMTEGHLLSLEVLALTLFLALVGGGVVARPEQQGGGLK